MVSRLRAVRPTNCCPPAVDFPRYLRWAHPQLATKGSVAFGWFDSRKGQQMDRTLVEKVSEHRAAIRTGNPTGAANTGPVVKVIAEGAGHLPAPTWNGRTVRTGDGKGSERHGRPHNYQCRSKSGL
jgi:hypothetical protein